MGDVRFSSTWDNNESKIQLNGVLLADERDDTTVNVNADYYPYNSGRINGNVTIDSLDMSMINSFGGNVVSDVSGKINGKVFIDNTIKQPVARGELFFDDASLKVNYTGSRYTFSDKVTIAPDKVVLKKFKVYDEFDNIFEISGDVNHKNLKDISLDIGAKFDDFVILNNEYNYGGMLYGKGSLSGNAHVTGKLRDLNIDANLATNPGNNVTVSLPSSKTATEKSFITFVDHDTLTQDIVIKDNLGMSIDAKADIDNLTHLSIILPYNLGKMDVSGVGNLHYIQNKNSGKNLYGDYVVNEGQFSFTFQNIIRRNFAISNGGTIVFNGDPMSANIDMKAVYQVRASLQGIPTSDPTLSEQRVQVNCIINFTGLLSDPVITFDIELPNAGDDIKSMVFASVDLNDQSVMAQQIFSLLLLKSFSFNVDNTLASTGVGANSLGILSGQLSQWLSQLNQDIDMGFNYRPAGEMTPEEFEVYMKTQFFDDRLIIDGNFGMQNKSELQTNNTNFIGDVKVEYKITDDGRLRVNAFNRTNQYSFIENGSEYTQGIGLSYYTEFDKIEELFRKRKKTRFIIQ